MPDTLAITVPGNLGNIEGAEADGVLAGMLTATDPDIGALLKTTASSAGLCITDDGGTYVDDSTDFNDADADDVAPLPATPAVDDACYFGLASGTFLKLLLTSSTQGVGTWTVVWEYWDGSAWTACPGISDGTTGFTAATGDHTVTWTDPGDWVANTVDGTLAYWVRARVSAYTSVTTQPLYTIGYVYPQGTAQYTSDLTDFTDAGTDDVALLPAYPVVGDCFLVGHSEKFCKLKVTTSTAGAGTYTIVPKYWNGSAWTALTVYEDDTAGWTTTAGTLYVHFQPPSDWVATTAANGPNGLAGFFISMELTAFTSMSTQPLGTQGWVLPIKTGAAGLDAPCNAGTVKIDLNAGTKSATNADSKFLLINGTKGTFIGFTWTKAVPVMEVAAQSLAITKNDELVLVQVTEDGTTEFADANFTLQFN